jgi:hypothetical protein
MRHLFRVVFSLATGCYSVRGEVMPDGSIVSFGKLPSPTLKEDRHVA